MSTGDEEEVLDSEEPEKVQEEKEDVKNLSLYHVLCIQILNQKDLSAV